MGNKDLERLIRKIIKEAPVDYGDYPERMDPKSQKKVEDPEGIFAKNRAFKGGVSDVEKIAGTRFKEVVDYVKSMTGAKSVEYTIHSNAGLGWHGKLAGWSFIKKETEYIAFAIKNAEPGSFITICSDVVPDALDQILKLKEEDDAS
jgi:hypothetical protein